MPYGVLTYKGKFMKPTTMACFFMPYGVLTDIFCIILGGIIGPNLNIKITKCERKAPKFIYGDISSLKNNDSISLFFIVLYF